MLLRSGKTTDGSRDGRPTSLPDAMTVMDAKIENSKKNSFIGYAERLELSDAYDGGRLQDWLTLSVRSSDWLGINYVLTSFQANIANYKRQW